MPESSLIRSTLPPITADHNLDVSADTGTVRRLLIVDNDPADVFLARQALQTSGARLQIDDVCDGIEAMRYLRQSGPYADCLRPHFVLLDLNMPRCNGFETLAAIRQDEGLRSLPVIVLTTSTHQTDINRAWDLQASCCLSKQLELDAFTRQLHHVVDFWCRTVCYPG